MERISTWSQIAPKPRCLFEKLSLHLSGFDYLEDTTIKRLQLIRARQVVYVDHVQTIKNRN